MPQALFTDTVGFIQKLPTSLVAAFRATLEEINDANLLLHVVDVSQANAAAQVDAVMAVLNEIIVKPVPMITVWNKVMLQPAASCNMLIGVSMLVMLARLTC